MNKQRQKKQKQNYAVRHFFIEYMNHYTSNSELSKKLLKDSPLLRELQWKGKSIASPRSHRDYGTWYVIGALARLTINHPHQKYFPTTTIMNLVHNMYGGRKIETHTLDMRITDGFKKHILKKPIDLIQLHNHQHRLNPTFTTVDGHNILVPTLNLVRAYQKLWQRRDTTVSRSLMNAESSHDSNVQKKLLNRLIMKKNSKDFEDVSFGILYVYNQRRNVMLYKLGRTNANDNGLDFVSDPYQSNTPMHTEFYQVTEVHKVKKLILDMDKTLFIPLTFVIQSNQTPQEAKHFVEKQIQHSYLGYSKRSDFLIKKIHKIITNLTLRQIINQFSHQELAQAIKIINRYRQEELETVDYRHF